RPVRHHAGDAAAVLGGIDISAVLGSGRFERPPEYRAVEVLSAVDVGRRQIDPAGSAQRRAVTNGHDDLLVVSWPRDRGSHISTAAKPETHRRAARTGVWSASRSATDATVSVHARIGRGEYRDEVLQRLVDVASQRSGNDHADRPEQRRTTEVHVEANNGALLCGLDFGHQLDLDTTDAIAVERHAFRWLVAHDRPFDPVVHALDLDDRLDDRALIYVVGQLAAPHPVDGQPLLEPGQVGGMLPGDLGRQWDID